MTQPPAPEPGEVITFYSYKGGSGRSMALANVACVLAQKEQEARGRDVLMIDWDLEAPGLHAYFRPYLREDSNSQPGVIELFREFDRVTRDAPPGASEPTAGIRDALGAIDLDRYVVPTSQPGLFLMRAGADTPDYGGLIGSFDWGAFYNRAPWLPQWFAARLSDRYAYSLIDSRTGETDTAGICTALMPEKLVAVFTLNVQNTRGAITQIRRSLKFRHSSPDERPLAVYPLPSRVEHAREKLREFWRYNATVGFQPQFEALFKSLYSEEVSLQAYFDSVSIPQSADYAYGERIAVLEERTRDVFSLAGKYSVFAGTLTMDTSIWDSPAEFEGVLLSEQKRRHAAPEPVQRSGAQWTEAPLYVARMEEAAKSFDAQAIAALSDEIIRKLWTCDEPFPEEFAVPILRLIRRQRNPTLTLRLAGALWESGQSSFAVRREYAQALTDAEEYTAAISVLTDLASFESRESTTPDQSMQVRELLGRAYKFLYLSAGTRTPQALRALETSLQFYREVYLEAPERRPHVGLNYVAVASRARRDGVSLPAGDPEPLEVARTILEQLRKSAETGAVFWHPAAVMELSLALDRFDDAEHWMRVYLAHPDVDVHSLLATRRHLTDLWQLTEDREPGSKLLPALNSVLLQRHSGVRVPVAAERVLRGDDTKSLAWYKTGLERSRSVARLETLKGRPLATGFVVRGGDLFPPWGDRPMLLAPSYVIGPAAENARGVLPPEQAQANFMVAEVIVPLGAVAWSSPVEALGVSVIELPESLSGIPPSPLASARPLLEAEARVFLIGHPGGRNVQFSITDNVLLDYEASRLHYRAPTEVGSSGSPIFDESWKAIGLHQRGNREMNRLNGKPGTYDAREGVWIGAVKTAIEQELRATLVTA